MRKHPFVATMSIANTVHEVTNKVLGTEGQQSTATPSTNGVMTNAEDVARSQATEDLAKPTGAAAPAPSSSSVQPTNTLAGFRGATATGEDRVNENTTVYTEPVPQVLESENHHVMTEAVPITHTSVPDYNEKPTAAPPIAGGDLYSILRDSGSNRSTNYTAAAINSQPVETSSITGTPGVASSAVPSYLQNATPYEPSAQPSWVSSMSQTQPARETFAPTSTVSGAGVGAAAGDAPLVDGSATGPQTLEKFEPTDEQAWSVRGPASKTMSRGPIDLAHRQPGFVGAGGAAGATGGAAAAAGAGAGDVQGAAGSATGAAGKQAGGLGGAVNDAKSSANNATGNLGKDALSAPEKKATDATSGAEKKASDAVSGAEKKGKDAVSGVEKQGKDAVSGAKDQVQNAASKPKKMGLLQKVKKSLKIGKEYK